MFLVISLLAPSNATCCRPQVRTIHVGDGSPEALPADVRSMLVFDEVRKVQLLWFGRRCLWLGWGWVGAAYGLVGAGVGAGWLGNVGNDGVKLWVETFWDDIVGPRHGGRPVLDGCGCHKSLENIFTKDHEVIRSAPCAFQLEN